MIVIDGEEYLDSGETARRLGVKRETLYAYVSRGLLRSYRQGIKRQRLYRRAEAVHEPPLALHDPFPRQVFQQRRIGGGLRREQPEALQRGVERVVPARSPVTPPVHEVQPVGGDAGPAVRDDQRPHPLRMPG